MATIISGNSDADVIRVGGDDVTVKSYGGDDEIVLHSENNYYYSDVADSAVVYAGDGNDTIENGGKNSTIYGEAGNDSIDVYSNNGSYGTYVNGGSGNDTINLRTEYDMGYYHFLDKSLEHITVSGGEGNDIFSFNTKSNTTISLVITDLENGDTLRNNYISNIGLEKSTVGGNIVLTEPGEGGINVTLQGVSDISQVSNVIYRTKDDRKTLGEIFGSSTPIPDPETETETVTTIDPSWNSYDNVNGTYSGGSSPTPTGGYDFYGSNETISAGSSSVVSSYQYYDQVNFKTQLSDFNVDGNNLLIHSNSGTLTILNARGNIMKYTENGNVIAQSYLAQASGDVNRQISDYYEIVIGAENADNHIYAGSGGSSLWGGNGGADTLTGGSGSDQFIYTFGSGNDVITNANADDIVNINDSAMNRIVTANVESSRIYVTFTDGGSLEIQSSANVGFKIGNEVWSANRSNGTWYKK